MKQLNLFFTCFIAILMFTQACWATAPTSTAAIVSYLLSSTTDTTNMSYAIVDTNQTLCYDSEMGTTESCSGKGYDADYDGSQPSYSLNEDGTIVTDNVTQLMWTQSTDLNNNGNVTDTGDKLSVTDAENYCSTLSLDDYSDWRLPDIKTLYSLVLFSGQDISGYSGSDTSNLITFIDDVFSQAFGDTSSGARLIDAQYASSTLYVSTTMYSDETMFGVNFVDGRIKGYSTRSKFYVHCVRGNEDYGVNDFTDNGDLTISDSATGLMWQQDDSEAENWDDAISQCESATTASKTDWRLPNIKELHSIVDYTRSPDTTASAALDALFNAESFFNEEGEIDWASYWSATTHANTNQDNSVSHGDSAAYISFGRALGYIDPNILDVHGAGAQRSDGKLNIDNASSTIGHDDLTFYYKGPQGDIKRLINRIRCVRRD